MPPFFKIRRSSRYFSGFFTGTDRRAIINERETGIHTTTASRASNCCTGIRRLPLRGASFPLKNMCPYFRWGSTENRLNIAGFYGGCNLGTGKLHDVFRRGNRSLSFSYQIQLQAMSDPPTSLLISNGTKANAKRCFCSGFSHLGATQKFEIVTTRYSD